MHEPPVPRASLLAFPLDFLPSPSRVRVSFSLHARSLMTSRICLKFSWFLKVEKLILVSLLYHLRLTACRSWNLIEVSAVI